MPLPDATARYDDLNEGQLGDVLFGGGRTVITRHFRVEVRPRRRGQARRPACGQCRSPNPARAPRRWWTRCGALWRGRVSAPEALTAEAQALAPRRGRHIPAHRLPILGPWLHAVPLLKGRRPLHARSAGTPPTLGFRACGRVRRRRSSTPACAVPSSRRRSGTPSRGRTSRASIKPCMVQGGLAMYGLHTYHAMDESCIHKTMYGSRWSRHVWSTYLPCYGRVVHP